MASSHGCSNLCSRPTVGERIRSHIPKLCVLWRRLCKVNISHITYIAIDSNKALQQVIAMFEMSRLVQWQKILSLYLIYTVYVLLYIYVYCVLTAFSNIYRRITAVNSLITAYCTVIGSVYYRKTLVATLVLIQVCMFAAMCCFLFLFLSPLRSHVCIWCSYKVVPPETVFCTAVFHFSVFSILCTPV